MRAYRKKSCWPVLAVLVLAVIAAHWVLDGGCTAPTDDGAGNRTNGLTVSEANCRTLDTDTDGFEIQLRAVSAQGRQFDLTRHVTMTRSAEAGYQTETQVTSGSQLVMTMVTSAGPIGAEVDIQYGPLVPGISSAHVMVRDGVLTGTFDGRDIVPRR